MAKVFPDGWRELAATGSAARELQTLGELAAGLDEHYTIYHGVHWTRVERGNYAIVGEIDFVIVGRTGRLLLIEQKTGLLTETAFGIAKNYADKEKDIPFQMARSADALHDRLRKFCKGEQTFVDSLLYCPDYTVRQPGTAGIDPARIVDARKKDLLIPIIQAILPATAPVALPGRVTLRSDINYRSPKDILHALNRLLPLQHPLEVGSPVTGSEVDIVSYTDTADMIAKTVSAVTQCIGVGFKRPHIALINYRGRENSRFTAYTKLGTYSLRAPTGQYDLLGNAIFTDGDLLIDSVHRFKGRAAPCVIFTEIDFDTLDDVAMRRLFVGATRATMKLTLVVSEQSAKVLLDRL